ncbi:hypothetical protein PanWU01x14_270870, partial [Parasponia andersonii]
FGDRTIVAELPRKPDLLAVPFRNANVKRLHHFQVLLHNLLGETFLLGGGRFGVWALFLLGLVVRDSGAVVSGEERDNRNLLDLEFHGEELPLLLILLRRFLWFLLLGLLLSRLLFGSRENRSIDRRLCFLAAIVAVLITVIVIRSRFLESQHEDPEPGGGFQQRNRKLSRLRVRFRGTENDRGRLNGDELPFKEQIIRRRQRQIGVRTVIARARREREVKLSLITITPLVIVIVIVIVVFFVFFFKITIVCAVTASSTRFVSALSHFTDFSLVLVVDGELQVEEGSVIIAVVVIVVGFRRVLTDGRYNGGDPGSGSEAPGKISASTATATSPVLEQTESFHCWESQYTKWGEG